MKVNELNLPVGSYVALQRWADDVMHELELVAIGERATERPVDPRLNSVARRVLDQYGDVRRASVAQADAALESGRDRVDIEADLPPEAVESLREIAGVFAEANQLCHEGLLLNPPLSDEVDALRIWIVEELMAQLGGASPTPCPL